jgi:hypothetical protein
VPTSHRRKGVSLIIALHGLAAPRTPSSTTTKKPPLAESHGYIVAAPLGYRVDGSHGGSSRAADPYHDGFSEQMMCAGARPVPTRSTTAHLPDGRSMGAIGTWKLGRAEESGSVCRDRDIRRQRCAWRRRADRDDA